MNTYEIRLRGELSDQVVEALGGLRPIGHGTTIVFEAQDRAALHAVIRRIEDLALELVSVTEIGRQEDP
jgi:hypothetical protein